MQEIVFRCTETTFGSPVPYIPNGTIIILVQDGEAIIGKYEEPTEDEPSPSFSHPINESELKEETLETVKSHFPNVGASKNARTFVCPDYLFAKALW